MQVFSTVKKSFRQNQLQAFERLCNTLIITIIISLLNQESNTQNQNPTVDGQ